jgi:hypothetical protein
MDSVPVLRDWLEGVKRGLGPDRTFIEVNAPRPRRRAPARGLGGRVGYWVFSPPPPPPLPPARLTAP